ncbi:MAG TPA: DNA primase, partial [Pseudonocardiaceae bacterium]
DAAVRDLVARRTPLIEFAIRSQLTDFDLDSIDGQIAALQKTVPLVARIKDRAKRDAYAAKLAWWVGWADEAMVVRRVRESAGAPADSGSTRTKSRRPADPNQGALLVEPQGPPRPDPRDVRTRSQREVLKLALQAPALAGPVYDSLPEDAFTVPAYAQLHHAILASGGTATGLSGAMLVDQVAQHCPEGTVRTLLSELAVERIPTRGELEVNYVSSMLAKLQCEQVARQIAEIKSRLQRMNPISDADEYRSAFGDLVAFEEYHRGLVKQASGAFE